MEMEFMRDGAVLALNCGSSSLKFGLYDAGQSAPQLLIEGEAEEIGHPEGSFRIEGKGQERQQQKVAFEDHDHAYRRTLPMDATSWKRSGARRRVCAIARSCRSARVKSRSAQRARPSADHLSRYGLPPHAARCEQHFAAPRRPARRGHPTLRISRHLPRIDRGATAGTSITVVVAHLGNGSSVTAIRKGHSQATTMALTPNAGMLMGTRCGDMDPGVVTWLMRHHGVNADEIDDVLNRKSGLLGVSGLSSDARELLTARASNRGADLALRMFALTAAQAIAAMGCVLGGVDLLVFTGGIGEHASDVRDAILHHLDWLPPLRTQTLPSREDLQIAAITIDLARQPST